MLQIDMIFSIPNRRSIRKTFSGLNEIAYIIISTAVFSLLLKISTPFLLFVDDRLTELSIKIAVLCSRMKYQRPRKENTSVLIKRKFAKNLKTRMCLMFSYLEHRLRKTRLRWFSDVKYRDENSILRRARKLEVKGRRTVGRSKKIWNKVVQKKHEEAKHHGRYGRG